MRKYAALKAALLVSAILFSNICSTVAGQTSLKGGCAKIDITPPVGAWLAGYRVREKPSDGISDQLYAKAMVLDDGRNKVAIVSADLLWVSLEVTTDVRKMVKERVGIAEENVLICATHTHFGPKIDRFAKDWPDAPVSEINQSYIQTLKQKIADSIIAADKNVKEVKVGVVKGEIPEVVYNRRTKRSNGSVAMTFRLPPAEPNLTFGPIDPQVSILKIEDANGALVGALVNFACHPVCGGPGREKFYSISADYPGRTAQVVEQMEGGICLFALGTAGDMNPVMADRKNPRSQIGRALGGEVLRRIQFVPTSGEITLRAMKKPVILPIKENLSPDRIVEADKTKEDFNNRASSFKNRRFLYPGSAQRGAG
jgi:hypothetical protein